MAYTSLLAPKLITHHDCGDLLESSVTELYYSR